MASGNYESTQQLLGELLVNKRGTESVRVSKSIDKNGAEVYDIRRWYINDDDEWAPTKKGVSIKAEMMADVIKLLIDDNPDLLKVDNDEVNQ